MTTTIYCVAHTLTHGCIVYFVDNAFLLLLLLLLPCFLGGSNHHGSKRRGKQKRNENVNQMFPNQKIWEGKCIGRDEYLKKYRFVAEMFKSTLILDNFY